MALFKKSKKQKTLSRKRKKEKDALAEKWFSHNRLLIGAYFLSFSALIIVVCFLGLAPASYQILPDQVSRIRVVADFDFSYESAILTRQAQEKRIKMVPPVFELDIAPYLHFEKYIRKLAKTLDALAAEVEGRSHAEQIGIVENFKREFEPDQRYDLRSEDLITILTELDSDTRFKAIEEGLIILRKIYETGIYSSSQNDLIKGQGDKLSLFNIYRESALSKVEVQSEEDALRQLKINLFAALDIKREISKSLDRILQTGLRPNLKFSTEKTEEIQRQVASSVKPVTIQISDGQTLIEPGSKVSERDFEQLNAFRQKHAERKSSWMDDDLLSERIFMTLTIMLCVMFFLKSRTGRIEIKGKEMGLCALAVIANLAIIRLIMEFASPQVLGEYTNILLTVLPYLAPTALAPMLIAILSRTQAGVLAGLIICIFNALMQGNSFAILFSSFLTTLVAIYSSRKLQRRSRVLTAGFHAGICLAIIACLAGIYSGIYSGMDYSEIEYTNIGEQMLAAFGVGIFTGIAVVGFLPILESLFKFTTDISLLELTDYNHPLLRRMQMDAPGSYHHSLMVANLSERAASEIGANPLLCRVCALFHDIGKLIKPEYFTENQSQGINPHIYQNPSMSALVIKSHIREGVILAKQYKLPKPIVDVIKQHHGTTLIQYFYYKALEKQKSDASNTFPAAPSIELDKVNEHTYRYEGPKPQFKESAVVFLADSIEAASRSLPKVTPQAIDELLDKIFQSRVEDHQLSECPLTFEELTRIKESFSFTLLNMLHSRIEYPSAEKQEEVKAKQKNKDTPSAIPNEDKKRRSQ